ncbi:DUF6414 family protein [Teichococcus wenyumeiae]|uniref:DUF6414 family protein n=1 Tax=Teichococcus wenyumeiae TaxID=2478470 RepID=UPI0011C38371|nr:hypothetical protein [Pseudoroseomonas wenyumeiae]
MSASDQAPGRPHTASVFDFIYHDARRVGSFLAQFEDAGVLQATKISEQATDGSSRKYRTGGKFNLAITSGDAGVEGAENSELRAGSEKSYDPFWSNALTFLDEAQSRGLLKSDISSAAIGDLVIVSGSLLVLDIGLLKNLWTKPSTRKLINSGVQEQAAPPANRQERRGLERHRKSGQSSDPNIDVFMDLMTDFPHSTQGWIMGQDFSCWFPMRADAMVTAGSDILLQHGTHLGPNWTLVGILDARPGAPDDQAHLEMALATVSSALGQMVSALSLVVRPQLGRPDHAFGLTPLLVLREINGT